jgi:hypothetical protein
MSKSKWEEAAEVIGQAVAAMDAGVRLPSAEALAATYNAVQSDPDRHVSGSLIRDEVIPYLEGQKLIKRRDGGGYEKQ